MKPDRKERRLQASRDFLAGLHGSFDAAVRGAQTIEREIHRQGNSVDRQRRLDVARERIAAAQAAITVHQEAHTALQQSEEI